MARLIDVDALVAHFRRTKIDEVFPNWKELFPSTQAAIIRLTTKYRAIVLSAPIVDAVPVVRCKDCKWWHGYKCTNKNGAGGLILNGDWFCCAGERKDNEI